MDVIDSPRAKNITSAARDRLTRRVVESNKPIAVELLPDDLDPSYLNWLQELGYVCQSTGSKGSVFLHKKEHQIK